MPPSFKRVLEGIAHEKPPGPATSFSVLHLIRALDILGERTVGRSKLAGSLGIGEGSVRTIISRLKDNGIVETSRVGCSLTKKGVELWKEQTEALPKKMEIESDELALTGQNVAILVKGRAGGIKSGIQQRDAAIMAGARSATTILFKKGKLIIPSVSHDLSKDYPKVAFQLIKSFQPGEDDVIIISSADDLKRAHYGALAAAWASIDDYYS